MKAVTLAESEQTGTIRDLRDKQSEIGRELRNLTDAICKIGGSEFLIRDSPQMKEAELEFADHRLGSKSSGNIDRDDLRSRIQKKISRAPNPADCAIPCARKQNWRKYVSEIRMVPTESEGKCFYVAEGEWDMLPELKGGSQLDDSEESPYFRDVAGAGFEPATFGL